MEMHADDDFSKCFDYASGATAERFQNPLWPIKELFAGSRMRESIRVVKEFGRRIVKSAVQDRDEQQRSKKEQTAEARDGDSKLDQISGTLIQSLLEALGDEQIVADAALTYLSAGRDTTGQALTWTFYLLLQHPSAVAKIQKEVQDLLFRHTTTSNPQDPTSSRPTSVSGPSPEFDPTLFTPAALPYTTAVFYEALRLFPPIPFEIRQAQADTTLPDGTFLPKHSVLVWCLWAMQRSRLTWGPDADEFRPERFLTQEDDGGAGEGEVMGKEEGFGQETKQNGNLERENKTETAAKKARRTTKFTLGKSSAEFPVFYGGARACLGRKMAEAIAVQAIPTVLVAAGVWLEGAWEGERRSPQSLTLPMEGGLPVWVRAGGGDEKTGAHDGNDNQL